MKRHCLALLNRYGHRFVSNLLISPLFCFSSKFPSLIAAKFQFLGFYVSGHPKTKHKHIETRINDHSV